MVATRRRTCASSSAKNTGDETESLTEPTSSVRRTRSRSVIVTCQTSAEQTNDSHPHEQNAAPAEPASPPKRKTRSSKRSPTDKQTDSTHEADVSESESCCSVVSDVQTVSKVQPTPRDRRRTARESSTAAGKQEETEVESHSLASVRTPRKSTRGQKKSVSVPGESTTSQEDDPSEAESYSSVASLSKGMGTRTITRSRRKTSAPPKETGHSEVESCSSTVSCPQGSTVRRSTRTRVKPTVPIPIHLEQGETPKTTTRPIRTRGQRGKAKSADDDQPYESEGCQSGPSLSPWRTTSSGAHAADSDSESVSAVSMSVDSPGSIQARVTPCSSRTGSANSSHAVTRTSRFVRVTLDVLNMPPVISKHANKDVDESEAIPDVEESEEMEEEAMDKTVISTSQECSVSEDAEAGITASLDQSARNSKAEVVQPDDMEQAENGEEAATGSDVMVIEESVQVLAKQTSVSPRRPNNNVTITEKDVVKNLQSADTIECIGNAEKPSEAAVKCEMVNMSSLQDDKEGSTSSSKPQEPDLSIQKSKPEKVVVSLLDSSEDEDSDDERLLEEEGRKQACVDTGSETEVSSDENEPGPSKAPDMPASNGLFVIDTRPGFQPSEMYYIDSTRRTENDNIEDEDFVDEEGDDEEDEDSKVLFTSRKSAMTELSSSIDPGLKVKEIGGLYISFDGTSSKSVSNNLKKLKDQKNKNELLKKSVIGADFEKKDAVPPYKESKRVAKAKRKEERAKTTGNGWFDMRAPELTEELKNDLKALQMRSAMDPKRFYKKNDREGLPKYFQVGTVVDSPLDFYHSRIPKNQRKRTIVEELLADADFRRYNKKKYQEIMTQKAAEAAGKMNKKHKFHKKR